MIKNMDTDRSGTVDLEEFCMFFDRVQSFNDMKEVLKKQSEMGKMKENVMAVYLLGMLVFAFMTLLGYVNSPSKTQEHFFLVLLAAALFGASFMYIVLLPLTQLTVRKWVKPPVPEEWKQARAQVVQVNKLAHDVPIEIVEVPMEATFDDVEKISWRPKKAHLHALTDQQAAPIAWDVPGAISDKGYSTGFGTTGSMALEDSQMSSTARRSMMASNATMNQTPVMPFDAEEDEEEQQDEEDLYDRPYRYDQRSIGSGNLRPHFSPWTIKKARVY
jgi:hypothetical protein